MSTVGAGASAGGLGAAGAFGRPGWAHRLSPSRPRLRAVPAPATRPSRAPFVGLVLALMAGGLIGVLMLNTMLAQDAFVLHELTKRSAVLADEEQALRQEVAAQAAPHLLASRARSLGMVKSASPVFLTPEGAILGVPKRAKAPAPVVVKVPPPPTGPAVRPRTGTTAEPGAATTAKPRTGAAAKPGTGTTRKPGTGTARQPGAAPSTGQAGTPAR